MTTLRSLNSQNRLEILQAFHEKHESDLLDLNKCRELKKKWQGRAIEIRDELNLNNPKSSFTVTLEELSQQVACLADTRNRTLGVLNEVSNELEVTCEIKKKFENYSQQLHMLECTLQYLKIVQYSETLCDELQTALKQKDDEQSVTIFANLSEVCRQLASSRATNLQNYLKETTLHWHNILKQKFSKEFDEALKVIKWPFVNSNVSLEVPLEVNVKKLQIIVEYLLQIDLPDELVTPSEAKGYLSEFPRLSLPMELMIAPLRRRFLYHFHGNRKTNRSDKPEWYFTKILSWIRDHTEFVEKWIQPVIDKMGFYYIDAKVELMRGLVQLAVEKLQVDLPTQQYDDFTFSHCIDEALGFDKELKESYEYSAAQPGALLILTQAQVFMKWIAMEKKYALEKMDEMLIENAHDTFHSSDLDMENLKIAPFAEVFITLLQTITDRYETLPQPRHRLQFLDLQLELLDDFRVRLVQLVNAEVGDIVESKIPTIANTIFYVENVLVDWGAMVHFLSLFYYKNQLEKSGIPDCADLDNSMLEIDTDSVFTEILSLFRHMRKDLLLTLAESVVLRIKQCSRSYRHEIWSQMKTPKDMRSLSLTPAACPMFEILTSRLHLLQKSLTNQLFSIVWRSIAQQIDNYLFEDLILENRFNECGALQLKFDVTRNLFPLFSQFTDRPDSYFIQLSEACSLLNITKGSALLLRETITALEGATGVEDRRGQALGEIGVKHFSPKLAVSILNRRTDITVNRIVLD